MQTRSSYRASSSFKAHARLAEPVPSPTMSKHPPDLRRVSTSQKGDVNSDIAALYYTSRQTAQYSTDLYLTSLHYQASPSLALNRHLTLSSNRHHPACFHYKLKAWIHELWVTYLKSTTTTSTATNEMDTNNRR